MNLLIILASQSENSTPRAIPGIGQDPGRQQRSLQKFQMKRHGLLRYQRTEHCNTITALGAGEGEKEAVLSESS